MIESDLRVVAFLHAKPGQKEAVRNALLQCVGPRRAEAGNLSYAVHADKNDPQLFVVVEHWNSPTHRERHLQTAHFQAMQNTVDGGGLVDQHFFHVLAPL